MSRFTENVKQIPWVAWLVAALLYAALDAVFIFYPMKADPALAAWPVLGKIALLAFMPLPLAIYALLVGYVYRDAKRRAMRHVLWTFIAALVPNGIGIILYFVLRDPLPVPCPACGQSIRSGYAFCPHCTVPLARACPSCKKQIERGWKVCAFCGVQLGPEPATLASRPA